jgi:hypothetical protein
MTRSVRQANRVSDETILYVIMRDRNGRVAHRVLGSALVQADRDAGLTTFALRKGIEPLTAFMVDSPVQAESAKQVLADLGDVGFDDRDFEPQWFQSARGVESVNALLDCGREGRGPFSEAVRRELEELRRILVKAEHLSWAFYLVDAPSGEDLGLPALPWTEEAG